MPTNAWILIALATSAAVVVVAVLLIKPPRRAAPTPGHKTPPGSCAEHSCGALDPVNDVEYNAVEIVKQSTLLEEHLAHEHKLCKSCVVKHLLTMVGYAEEILTLAGSRIGSYPLLADLAPTYKRVFGEVVAAFKSHDQQRIETTRLRSQDELRKVRRDVTEVYVLGLGQ